MSCSARKMSFCSLCHTHTQLTISAQQVFISEYQLGSMLCSYRPKKLVFDFIICKRNGWSNSLALNSPFWLPRELNLPFMDWGDLENGIIFQVNSSMFFLFFAPTILSGIHNENEYTNSQGAEIILT